MWRVSGVAVEEDQEEEAGVEGVALATLCRACSVMGSLRGSGRLVVVLVVVGRKTSFSLALGLPVLEDSIIGIGLGCSGSGEKSEINSRRWERWLVMGGSKGGVPVVAAVAAVAEGRRLLNIERAVVVRL